ncbi:MAG: ATP-binding cassette domain-containing protein, partial [Reyranella sp.]|nr:ATP-binding cassette domain-containing protein [Reyranella sp.]
MDSLVPVEDRGGPAQPLLLASGLRKHFPVPGGLLGRSGKVVRAVDDLSLSVAKGETLGVVGESGCGKSTVARLLIRLIKPDRGTMVLDGDPVDEPHGITVNELRRQVQMVFQDSYASLNPRLTIGETLAFAPKAHGLPAAEARARVRDLLDKVGLDPANYAERYPHELSGGQRQRVNIARALALRPRLVILDEAVSALDKSVEAQVLNLLADLKEQLSLSYIFISHDLNVVRHISDRVLVMYLGQIVESGTTRDIYASPGHPYTRALLSAVPTMDPERRTMVAPLTGDPPNPINPPSGCRFRTRCAFAEAICAQEMPRLSATGSGADHRIA